MKRILSLLMAFLITFTTFLGSSKLSFADNNEPSLVAQYAVLLDYETGKVLYDKNGHEKLYPASTTKLWTAYIVLKKVPDLNTVITMENLPAVEGSSMYLKDGESFTVKDLLYSLMVHSSNDVAEVLANYVSGSIEEFAKLMNEEAKAIGAKNTHFNNPHGLPDENHFTTAYDMALMSREAMSNDVFREIVKTERIQYPGTEAYPYERHFVNTNKFLQSSDKINYKGQQIDIKYDIVDGIKTGFTDDAGKCLVSSAVKNNMRVISAVFKSVGDDLYLDSRTLIDYGFDNYQSNTIIDKADHVGREKVSFTKQKELIYEPKHGYKLVLPKNVSVSDYTVKPKLDKIDLPVKKGDKVGTLEIYNKKELEAKIDLVATSELNSIFSFITENKSLLNILKIALIIVLVIFVLVIALIIRKKVRRKNRRRKNSIYSNKKKRRR